MNAWWLNIEQYSSKVRIVMRKYNYCCIVESTFGEMECFCMIKSFQDYLSSDKPSGTKHLQDTSEIRAGTSMHQTVEQGIHELRASFQCLKDWFVFEDKGCKGLCCCSVFALV